MAIGRETFVKNINNMATIQSMKLTTIVGNRKSNGIPTKKFNPSFIFPPKSKLNNNINQRQNCNTQEIIIGIKNDLVNNEKPDQLANAMIRLTIMIANISCNTFNPTNISPNIFYSQYFLINL